MSKKITGTVVPVASKKSKKVMASNEAKVTKKAKKDKQ